MKDSQARQDIRCIQTECKDLHKRYWELWHKIETIHRHFGIKEETIPAKTVLVDERKKHDAQ